MPVFGRGFPMRPVTGSAARGWSTSAGFFALMLGDTTHHQYNIGPCECCGGALPGELTCGCCGTEVMPTAVTLTISGIANQDPVETCDDTEGGGDCVDCPNMNGSRVLDFDTFPPHALTTIPANFCLFNIIDEIDLCGSPSHAQCQTRFYAVSIVKDIDVCATFPPSGDITVYVQVGQVEPSGVYATFEKTFAVESCRGTFNLDASDFVSGFLDGTTTKCDLNGISITVNV